MFDLFRSRDKAVRYLLGVLLGVVALSMVVTMIPGYGSTPTSNELVVAEVGRDQVTVRQVQALMQNLIRSRRVPPEMVPHYVPQLIDQMITERAVAFQAERMGFRVTDEDVANAIRSMLPPNVLGPGNLDRAAYAGYLQQQGLTVEEFERNIRANLLLLKLQNIALEGMIVTPSEVEQEYHRKNDKVKVEYVAWQPKDLRAQVTVSPDEIRNFYNTNRAQFNTPEKKSFHLLLAEEAKIGATVEAGENELRAAYSQNLDRYRSPERVNVRHILVKTTDVPQDQIAKQEAKANDLLKQIRGGADFAAIARQHSDDPGSKEKGGELGWVTRGQMVPPFEQAAFTLKPKEISNIVKTDFGFHIVQVLEKEEAAVKPFEAVRAELATEYKREAVYNRMQTAIEQARAELTRAPQNAAQIAAKYGLTHAYVENAGRGAPVPEVGVSPELDNNLAGLRAGEVSPVMQIGQDKLAVAAVTNVQAPKPAELAEVEPMIRETITSNKVNQLTEQRVKEMVEKLKGMQSSGDLNAIAKAIGGEVRNTQLFTADGAADGIGPASYLQEAFTKPVGATVGPITLGNQVFLAKVTEKQVADAAGLAAAREGIVLALKSKKAQERKELFEDGLMTRLIQEGKIKKNQDTIKRLIGQYQQG